MPDNTNTLIAFLDCETLGLDPDRHAIWEVGLVLYDPESRTVVDERLWQLQLTPEQIAMGDPIGMEIGRFAERYAASLATHAKSFFSIFFSLVPKGTHLAGAVVSFDEERLRRLAIHHGFEPTWHYHLIDVENLALGALGSEGMSFGVEGGIPFPWKSDWLGDQFSVTISEEDRHTALGDARWALRIYRAVMAHG